MDYVVEISVKGAKLTLAVESTEDLDILKSVFNKIQKDAKKALDGNRSISLTPLPPDA